MLRSFKPTVPLSKHNIVFCFHIQLPYRCPSFLQFPLKGYWDVASLPTVMGWISNILSATLQLNIAITYIQLYGGLYYNMYGGERRRLFSENIRFDSPV